MKSALILLLFAAAIGIWGCGSNVEYVPLDDFRYESRDDSYPIEVHRGTVLRPHVVLGVVTAERAMQAATNNLSTYDNVIRDLKIRAREVGGDALVQVKPVQHQNRMEANVILTGKVIRYLEKSKSVTAK